MMEEYSLFGEKQETSRKKKHSEEMMPHSCTSNAFESNATVLNTVQILMFY